MLNAKRIFQSPLTCRVGIACVGLSLMVLTTGCPLLGDPCADVTCDGDQTCVLGTCVDPDACANVTCDAGEECVNGTCVSVDLCAGVTCDAGQTCDPATGACVGDAPTDPAGFVAASAARGGALYDKWWNVPGVTATAPTDDHAFWATQSTNTRSGSDTWRCKECHGWDYKGANGAYATGSHFTGFAGIFGTTLTAQEAFDTIRDGHAFGTAGLTDADIWDLAKFVLTAQIDTDDILDANNTFTGVAAAGQATYDTSCAACHAADGLTVPPGGDDTFDAFVGFLSNDNPAEFQHKLRFGQPGTAMPAQFDVLDLDGIADLATYSQTLPTELTAPPTGGDAVAGETWYGANGCAACHGAGGNDGFAADLTGAAAATILEKNDGTQTHGGPVIDGITQADADNVAAWLAGL